MKTQVIKIGMLTGLFVLSLSLITVAQHNNEKVSEKRSLSSVETSKTKRWGFEFNLGGSHATRNLAGTSLNTGMGFEGLFSYRFLPHTAIYAGWGWNKFSADQSFAGSHMDFEETGYVYGVQFKHPVENTSLSYYFRAGGLYNHIELEDKSGNIIGDTGHGTGWQIAGGIELALNDRWHFTPGFKYNSLSRDVEIKGSTYSLNHDYLSLRVGFVRNF